ncbi:hypothetical protein [Microbacterium sp. H1-D42]|uniref:hypothetical protein n=1 Tax=Microbacterium sp. H1-D42 TaxID=2925844 RepID=UPI001F53B009|nr:hypothetical protein [Microbacterium sp. H1-D42]UNK71611.1 hypothetical protein MNR00_03890 [Microbacterium sp. H1-D42]
MSTGDPHGPAAEGVSVALAAVVGTVCFGALAILGLGMLSYFTDTDIISVEGLQLWPGVIGMVAAIAAYAALLTSLLRRRRPAFGSVLLIAVVTVIAHLVAVWISALLGGAGFAHATAAISQLVLHGSSLVVLAAGLIAGWIAVALRRARSGVPKWPWERGEDV